MGLVSEQCKYNLLTREVEMEVLPACESYGLGVIPWSPLAGGVLALGGRTGDAEKTRRNSDWSVPTRERHADKLTKFGALCEELGEQPADVALAWLLGRSGVTAPIIGPRTVEQLTTALHASDIKLEPDTLRRLDRIFPGYRSAPEQFAW